MGLLKSNVHNILVTYKAMGYLEQSKHTGKYRLGPKILELNRSLGDRYTVRRLALPYMQEIANATRERVYLAVPQEDEVLYLEAVHPAEDFSLSRSLLGVRAKMYCTGLGKAMMAHLPVADVQHYLAEPLESFTQNTITNAQQLMQQFEEIRQNGYAIDNMEHEFGVKCVAIPLFDHTKQVCAAISISGPSPRFDDDTIQNHVLRLNKAAKSIQEQLP